MRFVFLPALLFCLGNLIACRPQSEGVPLSGEALVTRGKQVYQSYCIACHNRAPQKDGTLGPSVSGASQELLEARIVHAAYPPGYQPKRTSKIMMPLPQLVQDIPSIHAYLNAPEAN